MEDNTGLPQLTEQLTENTGAPKQVSPVDYVYDSIKLKNETPSLLESIDAVKEEADYFSGIFKSTEDNRLSFNEDRININEAYTKLSGGDYITRYDEGFTKGADNEQRYAEKQSSGEKWVNGLGKFVGKTIVNTVGGTLGTAWGAVSAIAEGNWENIYDNSFYDFLDDQNTKMDNSLAANYRSQEERDMNFGQSMLTANFWADDFLGGLSFMAGTVVSESLWAAATGGASLTTTAARVGLRGSKYFNAAKSLTKGVKDAQRTLRKYNKISAINKATRTATNAGKAGEIANLVRFTYTGAGFEAGMEARLYQKEQRDNFYKDFESLNGRKPSAQDIANFEGNLDKTTNLLWVTNMALVGTSNFAVLGKTFGITSPFKTSSASLNKTLFGIGETTQLGKAGERVKSVAIKRNKLQKTLGFSKNILKNPFMEGFVEEGGQAASSGAMESYLTSRYNPSEDALGLVESMYDGFAHTYGTKEGWKEVGLGALIGLIGGEGSTALSGGGFFREAIGSLKDQDGQADSIDKESGSVARARNKNENLGTTTVDRIIAAKVEENIAQATELQNAEKELTEAESKGNVIGMATAQSKVMLSSVKNAIDFDYLEDQVSDFDTALRARDPKEIAEQFGIKESEVDSHIKSMVAEYEKLGKKYKTAKQFADYIVSDNPKELFEDATDIDVRLAKTAIAYQMVMTEVIEGHMEGAHSALKETLAELSPALVGKYMSALNRYNQISRSDKKDVEALDRSEKSLNQKRKELNALNNKLAKLDQQRASSEKDSNNADSYNSLYNKIEKVAGEVADLEQKVRENESAMSEAKEDMKQLNSATRSMASQLDSADPMSSGEVIEQITIEKTQKELEQLDAELEKLKKTQPQLVEKISKLAKEYKNGLDMWKRNGDTLQDLADPKVGLKRIGTMMQKKKQAGEETLTMLKRLEQTRKEEEEFSRKIESLIQDKENGSPTDAESTPTTEDSEQQKANENPGEDSSKVETLRDLTEEEIEEVEEVFNVTVEKNIATGSYFVTGEDEANVSKARGMIYQKQLKKDKKNAAAEKIAQLKQALKDLVGKNKFLLNNFTNDENQLVEDKAPTQEDVDEYLRLREKFKSGDINNLIGKPVVDELDEEGKVIRKGIGKRTKERSGLSDQEISDYQKLTQKMVDWRIVTATTSKGISVQNILDQIEAYSKEVTEENTALTAEQQLEIAREANYEVGAKNTDIAQTMTYVNVADKDNHKVFSHLSLDKIKEKGFEVTKIREENTGTEEEPIMVDVFELVHENGESIEVRREKNTRRRIYVEKKKSTLNRFLDLMGFSPINFNLKTAWGYVFQDGELFESDYNMDKSEGEKLHPEEIYKLKPGSVVKFAISPNDSYNLSDILSLITEGKIEEAKANMSIYVRTPEGKTVALLKAGKEEEGSNFDIVRQAAIEELQKRLENTSFTLEDLASDSLGNIFDLNYETEIEKVFIGTPNIQVDANGKVKVFEITEEQGEAIVGFGYSQGGKIEEDDDSIRMTYIPKNKNTPYVVIKQGETKIAYPVGLKGKDSNLLKDQILEILSSEKAEQDKVLDIINILKESGVEPAQFDLGGLESNGQEIEKIFKFLDNSTITFNRKDISEMEKKEFLDNSEITIDLSKTAFVSPKIKMNLSKKLVNIKTNVQTATKPLTEEQREDMLIEHLVATSVATNKAEVAQAVMDTNDDAFIKEFIDNSTFRKEVERASLANKTVPSISTQASMESLLQDVIDLDSEDVPLDIQEDFKEEVEDLKNNATKEKLKALAKKILLAAKNRYELVKNSVDTRNMYHIPTTETEQEMFELGFVRVVGDFYKKVDNKYSVRQLLEGLYNKHKVSFLPTHMGVDQNTTLEQFIEQMPDTLLDIYKLYYNTQNLSPITKKAAIVGNEKYMREDFKGEFAEFIEKEKTKDSLLYNKVLKHFQITDKGVLKSDLLTRGKIDQFEKEMGPFYKALLEYSLINKHIDLQEEMQSIIFAEDADLLGRLEAINDPNLPTPKGKVEIAMDGTVVFSRKNPTFVRIDNSVYEESFSNTAGEKVYEKIADIDPNFITTEFTAPFTTMVIDKTKEIDGTKVKINTTEGKGICN